MRPQIAHPPNVVRPRRILVTALVLIVTACSSGSDGDDSGPATTRVLAAGEHRIGVGEGAGGGEFFDRATEATFYPRGPAYLRLERVDSRTFQSVFPPGSFDAQIVNQDLAAIRAMGFNTVRVFFDTCQPPRPCLVDEDGSMNSQYADNVVEFLRIAATNGLQVLLGSNGVPARGYLQVLPSDRQFSGTYGVPEG